MRMIAALALLIAFAPAVRAQESDEEVKRRILEKVRAQLAEKKKEILDRMAKVIADELSGKAPRQEPGAATDKRVRDIERKLQALDDQRDDLQRDLRWIKRETEDAKIIKEAKGYSAEIEEAVEAQDQNAVQAAQESISRDHAEYIKLLEAKDFEKSIAGFKKIYYGLKDSRIKQLVTGFGSSAAYNVACGYALQGKTTEALDWLERSLKIGFDRIEHLRKDSDLDSLRKERRYLRLLADR